MQRIILIVLFLLSIVPSAYALDLEEPCPSMGDLVLLLRDHNEGLLERDLNRCIKDKGDLYRRPLYEGTLNDPYTYMLLLNIVIAYSTPENAESLLELRQQIRSPFLPASNQVLDGLQQLVKKDFPTLQTFMRCILKRESLKKCIEQNCERISGPYSSLYFKLYGDKNSCKH